MLLRVADEKRLPFAVQVPNATTAETIDRSLFTFIKQAVINKGTRDSVSLHRELKVMAEFGLLLHEKAGNQVFYQANSEHPIHKVFVKADEVPKLVNLVNL